MVRGAVFMPNGWAACLARRGQLDIVSCSGPSIMPSRTRAVAHIGPLRDALAHTRHAPTITPERSRHPIDRRLIAVEWGRPLRDRIMGAM